MTGRIKKTTIVIIIVCFIGLSLLLYPAISNYWNSKHSTKIINKYVEVMDNIDDDKYKEMWAEAVKYNKDLFDRKNDYHLDSEMKERYNNTLNVYEGMIGYIEIPKINVTLPVYHGTSDVVLSSGVGHIEWSSLPTGGEGTHCVLSGHRGLTSAKLFSDLDKMVEGDIFVITVMDETLTYEVDQIRTVEPKDVSQLPIVAGCDYCTLVTCTPYGINTHRLLVRGHRIENLKKEARCVSEAVIIDNMIVACFLAFPILFVLLMIVIFKKPAPKKPTGGAAPPPEEKGSDKSKQPPKPSLREASRTAPTPSFHGPGTSHRPIHEPNEDRISTIDTPPRAVSSLRPIKRNVEKDKKVSKHKSPSEGKSKDKSNSKKRRIKL